MPLLILDGGGGGGACCPRGDDRCNAISELFLDAPARLHFAVSDLNCLMSFSFDDGVEYVE